jgi:carnosine N-methyltransferase
VNLVPWCYLICICSGDFEEIYGAEENDARGHETQVGKWDAILTCFFIDTVRCLFCLAYDTDIIKEHNGLPQAKNIVNYLRILHRILAPGGIWINLGTLCIKLDQFWLGLNLVFHSLFV